MPSDFGPNVDDDMRGRNLQHGALEHHVFPGSFFAFGGEAFQGGGEIVARVSGFVVLVLIRLVLSGLLRLGDVFYGRALGGIHRLLRF